MSENVTLPLLNVDQEEKKNADKKLSKIFYIARRNSMIQLSESRVLCGEV